MSWAMQNLKNKMLVKLRAINRKKPPLWNFKHHLPVPTDNTLFQ